MTEGAQIVATENVMHRMSAPTGKVAPTPSSGWPTSTFFTEEKKLYFNDEGIQIYHLPNAHTDGDAIVFFRRSDVIAAGEGETLVPAIAGAFASASARPAMGKALSGRSRPGVQRKVARFSVMT